MRNTTTGAGFTRFTRFTSPRVGEEVRGVERASGLELIRLSEGLYNNIFFFFTEQASTNVNSKPSR